MISFVPFSHIFRSAAWFLVHIRQDSGVNLLLIQLKVGKLGMDQICHQHRQPRALFQSSIRSPSLWFRKTCADLS